MSEVKSKWEVEGHFYHCMKCGKFYRIINGQQIHQSMTLYSLTNSMNFSIARKHKCVRGVHPLVLHGNRRGVKGVISKGVLYG